MAKTSDAQIRASNKYSKEHNHSLLVKMNKDRDKDLIKKIESKPSKAGYIKELVKNDIRKGNIEVSVVKHLKAERVRTTFGKDTVSMEIGTNIPFNCSPKLAKKNLDTIRTILDWELIFSECKTASYVCGKENWEIILERPTTMAEDNIFISLEWNVDHIQGEKEYCTYILTTEEGTVTNNFVVEGDRTAIRMRVSEPDKSELTELEKIIGYKVDENFTVESMVIQLLANAKWDKIDELIKAGLITYGTVETCRRNAEKKQQNSEDTVQHIAVLLRAKSYATLREGIRRGVYTPDKIKEIAEHLDIPLDFNELFGTPIDEKGREEALKSALINRNFVNLAASLKKGEFSEEDYKRYSVLFGCELTTTDWDIINSDFLPLGDTVMQAYRKIKEKEQFTKEML